MAFDPGAIDATLAAAIGEDPALIAELRLAFVESAERALVAMNEAADDDARVVAARRLKGLAASFGAVRLMTMADQAIARPGDQLHLRRIHRAIARL